VITMIIVSTTVDNRIAVAAFITINEKLTGYFALFLFFVCTISHFALFTHLFYQYKLATEDFTIDKIGFLNNLKKPSYKRMGIVAFIILITVNLVFFVDTMRNGSVLNAISLDAIQITAHRGYSLDVPENTIPAIEKAIEEKADYIEVDVRSTKDGELVLLHDASLRRTTGLNQMIWDVTYNEIKELDAGSWLREDYANVKIPTLREIFEFTKGEAMLNIDLKHGGDKNNVVKILVDLIHEYNMEWQCIVTSTNLEYLEGIKRIDPSIRTGHISHRLRSAVVKSEYVDVLSLKSNLVTKNVVEEMYQNNKQVFVWTVNTKSEIERMSRLGVDNIITDDPVYAREVIYRSNADRYLVTLLKIVIE
jgi:glycerophosphoryl diester phosphodiesterase